LFTPRAHLPGRLTLAALRHHCRKLSRSSTTLSNSLWSPEGRHVLHRHREPPEPPRRRIPVPLDLAIDIFPGEPSLFPFPAVRSDLKGTD
jgi:hypothetical protein